MVIYEYLYCCIGILFLPGCFVIIKAAYLASRAWNVVVDSHIGQSRQIVILARGHEPGTCHVF